MYTASKTRNVEQSASQTSQIVTGVSAGFVATPIISNKNIHFSQKLRCPTTAMNSINQNNGNMGSSLPQVSNGISN